MSLCTMYEVLMSMCRLMAPFTPFFTETLYQRLRLLHPSVGDVSNESGVGSAKSVHYLSIPEVDAAAVDPSIVKAVETMQASATVTFASYDIVCIPVDESIGVAANFMIVLVGMTFQSSSSRPIVIVVWRARALCVLQAVRV